MRGMLEMEERFKERQKMSSLYRKLKEIMY